MKKMISLLIAALMSFSLAACDSAKKNDKVSDADVIAGGWTKPDSPEITDEVKSVLEKATSELDGADYAPVAYLGSQVVAGTNHLILCKVTPVVPDAVPTYALVTVYEKLDGGAEVTEVLGSNANAESTEEPGSWMDTESPVVTDEAASALNSATKGLVGAVYSPVALLSTQVVAGVNYRYLCEVTPVTPDAETKYAIVVVYEGADGTTSVVETFDFGSETAE